MAVLITLGVLTAIKPSSAVEHEAGIGLGAIDVPVSRTTQAPLTWAVMIANNDYPGTPDLEGAEAGVQATDVALANLGMPSTQRLLVLGADATKTGITRAIGWLNAHAQPQDTALVFYAAHVLYTGPDTQELTADGGRLSDSELAQLLTPLKAGHTWIVIAGCYGAGFDELPAPGRTLTADAPADQLSYENLDFGHSYLVEYLINRYVDRDTTIADAYAHAVRDLQRDFPTVSPSRSGRPTSDFHRLRWHEGAW